VKIHTLAFDIEAEFLPLRFLLLLHDLVVPINEIARGWRSFLKERVHANLRESSQRFCTSSSDAI
jgi:hypothetical protein